MIPRATPRGRSGGRAEVTGSRKAGAGGGLEAAILTRPGRRRVSADRIRRLLQGAARILEVHGEVALLLTGDATVRRLNARYRGQDKPTDVLSFPGPGGEAGLGDIVISLDTAGRNAPRFGRTFAQEVDVLALHGFLHVLGYDHEVDHGTMERLEARLRRRLLGRAARRSRR